MNTSRLETAQAQLSAILIDDLSVRLAHGLLQAVAEAYDVPIEQLSLALAIQNRAARRPADPTSAVSPTAAPGGQVPRFRESR